LVKHKNTIKISNIILYIVKKCTGFSGKLQFLSVQKLFLIPDAVATDSLHSVRDAYVLDWSAM